MYLCVYIESGNLDVCFAMTSALAGRGFVAMLCGMGGAMSATSLPLLNQVWVFRLLWEHDLVPQFPLILAP